MIPFIGPLISLITTGVEKYAENRKLKADHKNAIEQAKIRRIENLDVADANWDTIMAGNSRDSLKDEFWTGVLAIPAVMAFIPGWDIYVIAGFKALAETPQWYQAALGLAIAASFGYRKFADYMTKRAGNDKNVS